MDLDRMIDPSSSEPLSTRLGRRYGETAIGLLEKIRENRDESQLIIAGA